MSVLTSKFWTCLCSSMQMQPIKRAWYIVVSKHLIGSHMWMVDFFVVLLCFWPLHMVCITTEFYDKWVLINWFIDNPKSKYLTITHRKFRFRITGSKNRIKRLQTSYDEQVSCIFNVWNVGIFIFAAQLVARLPVILL